MKNDYFSLEGIDNYKLQQLCNLYLNKEKLSERQRKLLEKYYTILSNEAEFIQGEYGNLSKEIIEEYFEDIKEFYYLLIEEE